MSLSPWILTSFPLTKGLDHGQLRDRIKEDLKLKGLSPGT
jgi:hypothetical protein